MKTVKGLHEKMHTFDNANTSFRKAAKCKRYSKEVLAFSMSKEEELLRACEEVKNLTYTQRAYTIFKVWEPKERLIMALPFYDRVVQHMIVNIIGPVFEQGFYYHSYACREGKGMHAASEQLSQWMYELMIKEGLRLYGFKGDIHKYFASIPHNKLKEENRRYIGDKKALYLMDGIIDKNGILPDGVGIPVGNLTSQLFANVYGNKLDKFVKHTLHAKYYISDIMESVVGAFSIASSLILYVIGGYLVCDNRLELGTLIAFVTLAGYFTGPFQTLSLVVPQINVLKETMIRLKELMTYKSNRKNGTQHINSFESMEMQQVTFSYYGSTKPDVENVSMMLKKGEKIAFVGSSGSGKTTITKLLLNVFSHYQGQILVNGEDIKQICKEDIDRIFAIVTQVPMAMNGTIRENVDITNTLTDEEIYHYLDLVELKDDIEKFPLGLNTFVGENGQNISGGQKQRIAIARALALKPEVIIFDEATSNLDPLTERRICNNLKQLHITQIVVTHRLNAIQDADTIYVVEKGKIIESGTHVELLQLKGAYYDSVNN